MKRENKESGHTVEMPATKRTTEIRTFVYSSSITQIRYMPALHKMELQMHLEQDRFCQSTHDLAWPTVFKMNGYYQLEERHRGGLEAAATAKAELSLTKFTSIRLFCFLFVIIILNI